MPGFWLTPTYEDVAGKGRIAKARYIATVSRYADVRAGAKFENGVLVEW